MSMFTGILKIIGSQSSLNDSLLLRAGIPDAAQAIAAATQFLVKTRHLSSGQMIRVDGQAGTIGTVHIISMTDAQAVSPQFLSAALPGPSSDANNITDSAESSDKRMARTPTKSATKKKRSSKPSSKSAKKARSRR